MSGDVPSATTDEVDETQLGTKPTSAMAPKGTAGLSKKIKVGSGVNNGGNIRKKGPLASSLKKIAATHKSIGTGKKSVF